MNIGEVLGKPFKYIWKNSLLWALGMVTQIFPTIVNFLIYYLVIINYRSIQSILQDAQLYTVRPDLLNRFFGNLTPEQIVAPFLKIITILVFANLISFIITEFVRCCIIQGTRLADTSLEKFTLKQVIQNAWKPFGKLFLQDLFWGVCIIIIWFGIILVIGGVAAGSSSSSNTNAGIVVFLCCLACIAIPIMFFIPILIRQIRVSLVHDDLGVFSSIGKGWGTVKKAFGWMLLLGLILGVGSYIIRWLSGLLMSIPLNLATTVGVSNVSPELQTTQLIILAVFSLVGFILNSYLFAYILSAWTMAYRSVNYPPAHAILEVGTQTVPRDFNLPPAIPS
jgi:hypothetical protein